MKRVPKNVDNSVLSKLLVIFPIFPNISINFTDYNLNLPSEFSSQLEHPSRNYGRRGVLAPGHANLQKNVGLIRVDELILLATSF